MRRILWWCAAIVVAAVSTVACSVGPGGDDEPRPAARFIADFGGEGPGSLLEAHELSDAATTVDGRQLRGARVTYRSTSAQDGPLTAVTGTVFVPAGSPPAGGWPVVGFGHPTTGIDEQCAPSSSESLRGMRHFVAGLVDRGYAVAVTDYAGLGSAGVHRYTDHRAAGHNVIDSVRALRRTFSDVSDRWAAFGASQGGAAAWSADERAGAYAPELDLVGAVAIAPAADLTGLVDKARAGALTTAQHYSLASVIEVLARLNPDLNRDDYRRGAATTHWEVFTGCRGDFEGVRPEAEAALRPGDLAPATAEAAERLRAYLREWAVPQGPLSAPLFVAYAGRDASIDMRWTRDAIARACAAGGRVQWRLQPDRDHNNVAFDAGLAWMADRFTDKPVGDDCPG